MFKNKFFIISSVVFLSLFATAFVCFDILKIAISADAVFDEMIKGIITRGIFSIYIIFLINFVKIDCLRFSGTTIKSLIAVIPCFLVAINNFPLIEYFSGKLAFSSTDLIWLFALECVFVALMEEMFFRGVLFPTILKSLHANKKQIFLSIILSSAIFGLFHLVNLFGGSGILPVIAQVGYSFLLGGMLCFVLLKTKNVWLCVIIHAIYNFGGLLFVKFGEGQVWGIETIILTVIISVAAATYIVWNLLKTKKLYIEDIAN